MREELGKDMNEYKRRLADYTATLVNGSELAEWERKPGVRIWAMDVLGGGRYRLHYTDDKRKETTQ